MKMIWCKSCILPSTRPNLIIEKNGNCSACNNHRTKKNVNWKKRKNEFEILVNKIKKKNLRYDCVIPVSGGKDSTWQVIKCLEYGLNPLTVTWRSPQRTKIGEHNLQNLISLGVDHIDWTINPEIEKKLILKSLKKLGSVSIAMHLGIFNIPVLVASKFAIPLIIWGENSALEYGNIKKNDNQKYLDKQWFKNYGVTNNTLAEDWISPGLTRGKMSSYLSYKSFSKKNVFHPVSIFLGHYFKWDPKKTFQIAKKNGFKAEKKARTGFYNFADIDDYSISIHHWFKWYKFGFTRLFDNLSLEIRNKRITRSKAIEIIKKDKLKPPMNDIRKFCKYIKISEVEFFKIAEKFRNKKIWKKNKNNQYFIENFITRIENHKMKIIK